MEEFHRENPRVKTTILKVAGGALDEFRQCTRIECCAYRDILSMARDPNPPGQWALEKKNPREYKKLVQKDLKQHQEWIDGMDSV
jgi:hypothetical protein